MANEIEICNLALDSVGSATIQSFEEDVREAQVCKLRYKLARDFTLSSFDWAFARREKQLPLSAETFSGWTYVYVQPSDCLTPRFIYNPASKNEENAIPFEVAASASKNANLIVTDQEDAVLIYTAKITNTAMFTPDFCQALAWRLAGEIAIPLHSDINLAKEMKDNYRIALAGARAVSANAQKVKRTDKGDFYNAR